MASLTEQKRKEMEAEMNRFEQEILSPEDVPRMIIGANTFNKVQAALKAQHIPGGAPFEHEQEEEEEEDEAEAEEEEEPPSEPTPAVPKLLPPPPPPPLLTGPSQPLAPPPPPPRFPPAFVPPQLRHRPPAPPPRFPPGPPMGMHNRMPHGPPFPPHGHGPPFPPHGHGPPMFGPGPRGMGPGPLGMGPLNMQRPPGPGPRTPFVPAVDPSYYTRFSGPGYGPPAAGLSMQTEADSAVISKPKVVYSSPPVINVPKTKTSDTSSTVTTSSSSSSSSMAVVSKAPMVGVAMDKPKLPKPASVEKKPAMDSVDTMIAEIEAAAAAGQFATPQDYGMMGESSDSLHMDHLQEMLPPGKKEKKERKRKFVRTAAGQTWEDQTLSDWGTDDFRIFCGDLGNEVTDDHLAKAFSRYGSFVRAKVVRDKRSNKTKGYGFVSFKDPNDFVRAMREMNGKYVGNRPIKLRKSSWKERNIDIVRKKDKEKKLLGFR